jgi:hypothetical protein
LTDTNWQTEQFQRHRPHLERVAYRMLGSTSEAEDALQEAGSLLGGSQQKKRDLVQPLMAEQPSGPGELEAAAAAA